MNQSTKDIISGFISGWTQVIIMQPFEIIKVRLQTQSSQNPKYNGIVDAFKKILAEEGPFSFYKGSFFIKCRHSCSINWNRFSSLCHVFHLRIFQKIIQSLQKKPQRSTSYSIYRFVMCHCFPTD